MDGSRRYYCGSLLFGRYELVKIILLGYNKE